MILPESVTKINSQAFAYCDKLATVSMPGVTSIGEEAFFYCTDLGSVYMPKVVTLGDHAFRLLRKPDCHSASSLDRRSGGAGISFCIQLIKSAFPSTLKAKPV